MVKVKTEKTGRDSSGIQALSGVERGAPGHKTAVLAGKMVSKGPRHTTGQVKMEALDLDADSDDGMVVTEIMTKASDMVKTPFYKLQNAPKTSSLSNLRSRLRQAEAEQGDEDKKWARMLAMAAGKKDATSVYTLKKAIKSKESKLKKKNRQRGLRALNAKKARSKEEAAERAKLKRPKSKEARLGKK